MDIYKLGFLVLQIVALAWMMFKVQARYKRLTAKFISNVKMRLVQLNVKQLQTNSKHKFELTFEKSELEDLRLT